MPGTEPHPATTATQPRFTTAEGLRALLNRLHQAGPGAWRDDPEAAQLLRFAAARYATLARKHRLEPDDAARAAFETMLNESTRTAQNPWAVVTVGVRASLVAEERADGLLISPDRARRARYAKYHDAVRLGDDEYRGDRNGERANGPDPDLAHRPGAWPGAWPGPQNDAQLIDVQTGDIQLTDIQSSDVQTGEDDESSRPGTALAAMNDTAHVLVLLGWPADVAAAGVDYVCSRLVDAGTRLAAYENLRRDKAARAQLDLPHRSWIALLRIVLGHARSPHPRQRLGTLARLVIGETIEDLLNDDDVVRAVVVGNPAEGART